jgi:hypothetical protein
MGGDFANPVTPPVDPWEEAEKRRKLQEILASKMQVGQAPLEQAMTPQDIYNSPEGAATREGMSPALQKMILLLSKIAPFSPPSIR